MSHKTHEALALPPKYLHMYGDFVTKNASAVGQIEGALRSLTYILPGIISIPGCYKLILLTHNRSIPRHRNRLRVL